MQDVVALEVCMNETLKTIVGILETGRTELQVAAAQILGELRSKDSSVVRALAVASSRSSVLGRYAIEALGQIGSPEALQVVVDLLSENQMLADQAVRLLGEAEALVIPLPVFAERRLELPPRHVFRAAENGFEEIFPLD